MKKISSENFFEPRLEIAHDLLNNLEQKRPANAALFNEIIKPTRIESLKRFVAQLVLFLQRALIPNRNNGNLLSLKRDIPHQMH